MKHAALRSSREWVKKQELLERATERREEARKAWRQAVKGDRARRWAEYLKATAAELKAAL